MEDGTSVTKEMGATVPSMSSTMAAGRRVVPVTAGSIVRAFFAAGSESPSVRREGVGG